MPGLTAEDKPVLGGGDLAGIFAQDNEAAQELVAVPGRRRSSARSGYGETSGTWISPRTDFDTSLYPNETCAGDRRRSPTSRPTSCSTAPTRCPARSAPAPSGGR